MKRVLFFLIICHIIGSVHSQIRPFQGIYNLDSCEFESKCKILTFSDTANDLWQWGKPQKPGFGPAFSYPRAVMTDSLKPYPKSVHTHFDVIVPDIFNNLIVGFKHKYQTDSLLDGGYVDVSYDSGKTWNNVIDEEKVHHPYLFETENMYSNKDSLIAGKIGFSGTSEGWVYSRIQWVWFMLAKKTFPQILYLRFHFISDSLDSEKSGWVIDNLLISRANTGTSVKRVKNDPRLKYYPNPMTTETVFSFDNSIKEKYTLQLYNSYGQLVKTQSEYHPQSLTLKRDNLNGGLYYFILKSESGFQSSGNLMVE